MASFKKTLCKFWQQGYCRRGDRCTWAHGEQEVAAATARASNYWTRGDWSEGNGYWSGGTWWQNDSSGGNHGDNEYEYNYEYNYKYEYKYEYKYDYKYEYNYGRDSSSQSSGTRRWAIESSNDTAGGCDDSTTASDHERGSSSGSSSNTSNKNSSKDGNNSRSSSKSQGDRSTSSLNNAEQTDQRSCGSSGSVQKLVGGNDSASSKAENKNAHSSCSSSNSSNNSSNNNNNSRDSKSSSQSNRQGEPKAASQEVEVEESVNEYMEIVAAKTWDVDWQKLHLRRGHCSEEWLEAFQAAGNGTADPNMQAIRLLRTLIWRQTQRHYQYCFGPYQGVNEVLVPPTKVAAPRFKSRSSREDSAPTFRVSVEQADIIDKARSLLDEDGSNKVAILSMACASCPGGGVERGAGAQEETLWRRSDISKYKDANRRLYPLKNDESILYRDVRVMRESEAAGYGFIDIAQMPKIGVIATAAKRNPTYNHRTREDMRLRIRSILAAAKLSSCTHLLLSAFGCGAFCNPPEEVARLFREELTGYQNEHLKSVTFCIIDDHNARKQHNPRGNYWPFCEEFAHFGGPAQPGSAGSSR